MHITLKDLSIVKVMCFFDSARYVSIVVTEIFFTLIRRLPCHQRVSSSAASEVNKRQLNRLLDGVDCKLTSTKWAAIAKCSTDTALRDITQLLELGVLKKSPGGGRSTSYDLAGR